MRLSNEDVLLHWPLAQHIITAGWLYNDGSLHRALDFRAAVGTPVYAAEGGTVETAYRWNGKRTQGDTNSYGNMVKLRHTTYKYGTLETLYAHLSKLCVTQGQQVQEGQLIGYSGDTGNCYGAHLHFEVRWKGQRTNPLNWLDSDFSKASSAVRLGSYSSVKHNTKEVKTVSENKLQRVTITPNTDDEYTEIAKLFCTLGLPLSCVCSSGDAMALMHAAQAGNAEYKSKWV